MALQTANQFRLTPDIAGSFSRGMQLGDQFRQSQQQPRIEELTRMAASGDKQALIELQSIAPERAGQVVNIQGAQQKQDEQISEQRLHSVARGALEVQSIPTVEGKIASLNKRRDELVSQGVDTQDTDEILSLYSAGRIDKANQIIDSIVKLSERQGVIKAPIGGQQSAEGRSFEDLISNFSAEDKTKARRVKAGLDPRMVGSATQTIANLGTAPAVADVEAVISGAKEVGKLKGQKKLKPEVEAAVVSAVGQAKAEVTRLGEERSNSKTLGVYETAMGNLTKALDETVTGPFIGLTPAMTSNAQIADGAVAMMLPLMKDVFRGAGEGTFTEGDQKILTDLIPTRSDTAAARASKISMIDSMIRAKLKESPAQEPQAQQAQQGGLTEAEQAELQQLRAELGQ